MSWGARETLAGGQRTVQRGQTAAGVKEVGLLRDLTKQGITLFTAEEKETDNKGKKSLMKKTLHKN